MKVKSILEDEPITADYMQANPDRSMEMEEVPVTQGLKVAHDEVTKLIRLVADAEAADTEYKYSLEYSSLRKQADELADTLEHTIRAQGK